MSTAAVEIPATLPEQLPIETGDFHDDLFSEDEDVPHEPSGDGKAPNIIREGDMVIEEDDETNYNKGEGDDDNEAKDGDAEDEEKKKKKSKPKSKRPKLDPQRLLNEKTGLPHLLKSFPKHVKFKHGRGYESHNLRMLMDHYDVWMDQLMPSMCLSDVVDTIERLGHKAAVKEFLLKMRVEQCLEKEQLQHHEQQKQADLEAADEYFDNQPDAPSDDDTGNGQTGTNDNNVDKGDNDDETAIEAQADIEQGNGSSAKAIDSLATETKPNADESGDSGDDDNNGRPTKSIATTKKRSFLDDDDSDDENDTHPANNTGMDTTADKAASRTEFDTNASETHGRSNVNEKAEPEAARGETMLDEIDAMLAEADEFQQSMQDTFK